MEKVLVPAFAALDDAPAVRAAFVANGEVLQALESEAPEQLEQLRVRAQDGRLEALAVPIYEPHLGQVPERDALAQTVAHIALLRRMLDVRAHGLFVPWSVYDRTVPPVAEGAGLDWVALRGGQGVVSVESAGSSVRAVGWRPMGPGESALVEGEVGLVDLSALHRDGGMAWFQQLLTSLPGTRLPSEVIAAGIPAPRSVWAPTQSAALYRQEWGAADLLHQRVMATSQLVARFAKGDEDGEFAADPVGLRQAQRYLWRAQAGDVFTDGQAGGIRSPDQRHRAWRDVLRSERVALEGLRAAGRPSAARVDLDGDGIDEVMLRSPESAIRLVPARRGGLASWSVAKSALQLAAVPRRTRAEWEAELRPDPTAPPNPSIAPEHRPGQLHGLLREDVETRLCFDDRFLHASASLARFESGLLDAHSTGLDTPWEIESCERSGRGARTTLVGRGELQDADEAWPVEIRKRYALRGSEIELRYEVQNRGLGVLRTRVLFPLDLSLGAQASEHQIVYRGVRHGIDELDDEADVDKVRVLGAAGEISIQTDTGVRLWRYPIHTVHRHGGEPRAALQGVCLGLVWLLQLWARETAVFTVRVSFTPT